MSVRVRPIAALVPCCLLILFLASNSAATTSYHVGNSLTWDSVPASLRSIASQRDLSHEAGYHIRCGSSLNNTLADPEDTCVPAVPAFGTFTGALANHPWDFVTIQPYTHSTSTFTTDLASIQTLVDLTQSNPVNADTKFFIYSAWPTRSFYQQRWTAPSADLPDTLTTLSRAYQANLIEQVRETITPNVYMIPVGEVLYELDIRLQAGELPGFSDITDFYRDPLHLSEDLGRYVAAVTTFATLFEQDPAGLVKPNGYFGSAAAFSPEFFELVHDTIRHTVVTHPYAGVDLPIPTRADFNADGLVGIGDLTEWHDSYGVTLLADTDGNNLIDGGDFLTWQRSLSLPADSDFNEDSLVNAADLAIWESSLADGTSDGADFLRWQRELSPIASADFDRNGFVASEDLSQWQQSFGLTDQGDSTGDGITNGADFLEIQRQFTQISIADFDQDRFVDGQDLATWSQGFGQHLRGDANGDFFINGSDFLLWQNENGLRSLVPESTSSTTSVPEPDSLVLLLAFVIACGATNQLRALTRLTSR